MAKNCIKFEWPKAGVLKLIEQWSTYECLYNPKNVLYHNKHARYDAFLKICKELQEDCPNVEVNDVKIKITYLRGQYARELAKEKGSHKSGAGTDEVYKSSAYWYPYMSFIHDFVQIRKAPSNLDYSIDKTTYQNEDCSNENTMDETPPKKRPRTETPTSNKNTDSTDDALQAASQALRFIASSIVEKNSVDDSFINFIKDEMSSITDTTLKTELRKKIIQDIFEVKEKMSYLTN